MISWLPLMVMTSPPASLASLANARNLRMMASSLSPRSRMSPTCTRTVEPPTQCPLVSITFASSSAFIVCMKSPCTSPMATSRRPARSTLVTGCGTGALDPLPPLPPTEDEAAFLANAGCAAASAGAMAAAPASSARRANCCPCDADAAAAPAPTLPATATVIVERRFKRVRTPPSVPVPDDLPPLGVLVPRLPRPPPPAGSQKRPGREADIVA
mmetsp:Transcript_24547/g.39504  ORF Transcript_24547/g.39504 Transcript_24547/m.39504 type:complete len:214 (-) Transcript_24547:66-707(-)